VAGIFTRLTVLLAGAAILSSVGAENPGFEARGFQAKGFKVADHYPPPHETQIKSLLEGGKATPLGAGKTLLSDGVTLQTFTETNTLQIRVMAPQCLYDSTEQTASSAGPLRVQTPDGKFIEGEGFLWRQTNSSLFISNKVHTTLRSDAIGYSATAAQGNQSTADEPPSEIFSREFRYISSSGEAIYEDNVRVTGTNLNMTCGKLKIDIPKNERQLQNVIAEHDVAMDYKGIQANGQRADFSSRTGLVRIGGGRPTWRAGTREGHGNELIIDRTNGIFQAQGDAFLKMTNQSVLSASGSALESGKSLTNRLVEVFCDNYELRSNWGVFRKEVQVKEHSGEQLRGKMNCELMTLSLVGTNELQTLVAETNVVIEQDTNRFVGGKAVYNGTNGMLDLTENPRWQAGTREGKGDLLRVDTRTSEMLVLGDASMRLPADEFATDLEQESAGQKSKPKIKSGPPEFAEIFSQEYTLRTNSASFRGGVHACHPRMEWFCDELTVGSTTGHGKPERILAEQNVKFEFEKENGERIYGTGDKAVYHFDVSGTVTNELLTLTGNKAILVTTNGTYSNERIIYDRAHNSVSMPGGGYRIEGVASSVNTNMFALPKHKVKK